MRLVNSDIITRCEYDANDNPVSLTDAHGIRTRQAYDALDRPSVLTYPDGSSVESRYDGNGNVIWTHEGNGLATRARYDPLDRLAQIDVDASNLEPSSAFEGATKVTFRSNALGRMIRARSENQGRLVVRDRLDDRFRRAGV